MATLKICGYVDGNSVCYFEGPLEMGTILGQAVTSTLESISMEGEVIQSYFFIPLGRRPIAAKPESKTIANAVYTVYLADAGLNMDDNVDALDQSGEVPGPSNRETTPTPPVSAESPVLAAPSPGYSIATDPSMPSKNDLPESLRQHNLFEVLRKFAGSNQKAVCSDTIQKLTKNRALTTENLNFVVGALKRVIIAEPNFDPSESGIEAWPNKQIRKAYFFHLAKTFPCLLDHIGEIVGHPRRAKLCKALSNYRANFQRYVPRGASKCRADSSDVSTPTPKAYRSKERSHNSIQSSKFTDIVKVESHFTDSDYENP
uniref:BEN domain-containing protein n=1 Tax=Panagrellus redivivus TaxID=6233 RepID=A0A7E4WAH9_PANRE